jgi:uncharacterized protein YdaU (DUF1376 family)
MHFYKRDPNAAFLGMAGLTLEERGAYNSILDLLYATDDNLTNDDVALARMLHVQTKTWKRIRASLEAKGKVWANGTRIAAKRVTETILSAKVFSTVQSERANKRWTVSKNSSEINDDQMPLAMPGQMLPIPIPRREERKSLNGHGEGKRGKPRHGQRTKDGKRVWFDRETLEWKQYAADYAEHHGHDVSLNWNGAGSWFYLAGEETHRLSG